MYSNDIEAHRDGMSDFYASYREELRKTHSYVKCIDMWVPKKPLKKSRLVMGVWK